MMASMTSRYGPPSRLHKAARRTGGRLFILLLVALAAAAPAIAATPRLLVLGDSLAAGYGLAQPDGFQARLAEALKAAGHEVTILDGGVSGDTSAGGRSRLDWVLADQPDAAIVELGGNDGLRGTLPAEMEANIAAILDALAARHIPVLLSGMLAPPNMGDEYGRAFAAVFDRLGRRPGLLYDRFFLEGVAGDPNLNQPDHIHPNPEGVRRVVARLLPMVEKLLAEVPAS